MEDRRHLPSVDRILASEPLKRLGEVYPRSVILSVTREHLEGLRECIKSGLACPPIEGVAQAIGQKIESLSRFNLKPVINATGVILHTNLGRAPLSRDAIEAMALLSDGYCNLEFDIESGKRGSRRTLLENLICRATGAEAALVVNNNASAVLLGLNALAKGKEVIVSRGQAVEIGGGFRIPDVMRQSGVKLVEVGTTNRTNAADYEQAITPRTVALLRVHSSNFKVIGFTGGVTIEEMAQVAVRHDIIVLDDVGSGCLLDATKYGLDPEPTVQESISKGAGLAFFSGDKLLGGPQVGIVAGRKDLVDRLARHPLMRAMRVDRARLAGLGATLLHYLKGEAESKVPVWRMIAMQPAAIRKRAEDWAENLGERAAVTAGESMIGGGSLPGSVLPTFLVSLKTSPGKAGNAEDLARALRQNEPPIIARIEKNRILLDPRTVEPEKDEIVAAALRTVLAEDAAE